MDVYIQSEIGICQEFIPEGTIMKKQSVSVVISPLKINSDEVQMSLKVISGCNMWIGCRNAKCFYSKAGREAPKIKAQS